MIYCFSGTGNSLVAAQRLSRLTGSPLLPMTAKEAVLPSADDDVWGLVFPVYAWGLPAIVEAFIKRLKVTVNVNDEAAMPYTFALLTCGDDVGRADVLLRRALQAKGVTLNAVFSVQMRNTYVCLPGFDVDSAEVVRTKEQAAHTRLEEIAVRIINRKPSVPGDVHPGPFPWTKSHVLRPLFNAFLTHDSGFHVNPSTCTRCGMCGKVCPLGNIAKNADNLPTWQGRCTLCLRCYHACPHHAVAYGKFTVGKGQVKINPYLCRL